MSAAGGTISADDARAQAVTAAIQHGDVETLQRLIAENPGLASVRVGSDRPGAESRTLMHLVTDWPGHFPRGPETVAVLAGAGADANARSRGRHAETPLHWAASSNDVAVLDALLDALLDAGADIEAPGAVIGGGSPLADARGFRQWDAAFRLIERGATVDLFAAATLGLTDRIAEFYAAAEPPSRVETDRAFWSACHGGRLGAAELLWARGADLDGRPPWSTSTPLDAALDAGAPELVSWLRSHGAQSAVDLPNR